MLTFILNTYCQILIRFIVLRALTNLWKTSKLVKNSRIFSDRLFISSAFRSAYRTRKSPRLSESTFLQHAQVTSRLSAQSASMTLPQSLTSRRPNVGKIAS